MKENFVKVWFGVIAGLIILPFLFVAFFNYPSADDFVFAYKVKSMGFFQAQYDWYVHWTGRFFSTFILSLHPLVFNSNLLYKLYAIILILLTLHAVYRFVKLIFKNKPTYVVLFFTCLLTGVYLNNMPILVQGIYWMPGAITYQLANILLLHFFVNIINDNKNINRWKYYILNAILIIAICGSNETSMVVVFILITTLTFFSLISLKKHSIELTSYFFIVLSGVLIVAIAPGNNVRNSSYNEINYFEVYQAVLESLLTAFRLFINWVSSIEVILISLMLVFFQTFLFQKEKQLKKREFFKLSFILIVLYLIISSSLFLVLWYSDDLLPRALNISFWVFLIGWLYFVHAASKYIKIKTSLKVNNFITIFTCALILIIFLSSNNNYYLTVSDIFSEKLFTYQKEINEREKMIKHSKKEYIIVPSLSAYPNSIFYLEPSVSNGNYFMMAPYFGKKSILLNFIPSKLDATYNVNMDDEFSYSLQNNHTITNEAALSKPNSCLLSPQQQYSVIFQEKIYKINTENFKTAYISANIYSSSDTVDLAVVFIVENQKKELIKWQGKDIVSTRYKVNKWNKEEVFFYLDDRKLLNKYNIIKAYIWNRGQNEVYVDDLVISFF